MVSAERRTDQAVQCVGNQGKNRQIEWAPS